MSNYWFNHDWSSDDRSNRRRDANKLQRIAKESAQQEQSQVERWLDLAKKLFDGDDGPDPAAA
ncbi:MAG TPA: hypothetical protein VNR20_01855 [Terriglobales bacterium]|nr:hypothetical protein [Terriglobales bacterium]